MLHIKSDGSNETYSSLVVKSDDMDEKYVDITVTEFSLFKVTPSLLAPSIDPNTGNNSNIMLLMAVMIISLSRLVTVICKRKMTK